MRLPVPGLCCQVHLRLISSLSVPGRMHAAPSNMADITAKFGGLYEAVKDAFLEDIEELRLPKMAREWINRMCDYNIPGGTLQRARRLNACQGKMNRGLSVVETAVVVGGISLHEEAARDFIALGWCIEWLQASFLIADDIMDQSTTRRGQRCWYLNEGVGMVAINDCFMLQSMLVRTIKRHFGDTPAYLPLLELFLNTKMQTELGQLLDLLTAPACAPTRLEIFTMETYRKIVRYKTCYYSFYLPIVSCLIALGVHHEYPLDEVARILVDMGEFFQIQVRTMVKGSFCRTTIWIVMAIRPSWEKWAPTSARASAPGSLFRPWHLPPCRPRWHRN